VASKEQQKSRTRSIQKIEMNYLLNLWRFPVLSLVLSSLFLVPLPARAGTQVTPAQTKIAPASQVALDQTVKVSPQLEKQILEVIRRNPNVLIDVLKKYTLEEQQKEQKAQQEALKLVRRNTKAMIGDSPTMGATDRKIVMVEFSDFQCPYCAAANQNVKQFMAKHKDKVTLVYKHFPLTQAHPEALPAARAAWAANKQGKFWEYQDALFANQPKLGEALYLETATKLKLDLGKFNTDRKVADPEIVKDFRLGRQVGVEGTPTFILNGEVLAGPASIADFEKVLAKIK
jgi:protein-disulfide isomerase